MIAIIPARGGSKGLPGKNIKKLAGKPLIAYAIEEALQAKEITRVIVSTDSEEIAEVAREYKAEVPFIRPASLAGDRSSAIDVYLHAAEFIGTEQNEPLEDLVVLLPTVPLRTSEDIDNAIHLFKNKNADAVLSFTPEQHPIAWHRFLEEDGKIGESLQPGLVLNRQEAEKSYYPNGAVYVLKTELLRKGTYYSDKSYAYLMPASRSVDIDTQEDFDYAEFLINRQNEF